MKKNTNYLLIAGLILALLAVYLIFKNNSGNSREELRDFAVKDTAAITKIFLADRSGNSVAIKRRAAGGWLLNDSLPVKRDMIQNLLNAFYSISIKTNVPKTGYNNVVKNLATSGIKCEIYLDNPEKAHKIYYVGDHTQDALGTFMMLERSTVPFVTEIPGFNGYLTPRYSSKVLDWKETILFRYANPLSDIQSVIIDYPPFPERSFELSQSENYFQLRTSSGVYPVSSLDSIAVLNYLDLFRNLYYEGVDKLLSPSQKDSLVNSNPLCNIKVTGKDGKDVILIIHPMPLHSASLVREDTLGLPLKYDVDRMYGYLPARDELVVLQKISFERLFRTPEDFMLASLRQQRKKTVHRVAR